MIPSPADDGTRAGLAREARHLHACLLGTQADPLLVERYVAAVLHCFPATASRADAALERIVAARLDVEALEIALRSRALGETLGARIRILLQLVEAGAEHATMFTPAPLGLPRAIARLAACGARTAWKRMKGTLLARIHGLA